MNRIISNSGYYYSYYYYYNLLFLSELLFESLTSMRLKD